jgi:hypothetical protein
MSTAGSTWGCAAGCGICAVLAVKPATMLKTTMMLIEKKIILCFMASSL